jgi:hypothetical protein
MATFITADQFAEVRICRYNDVLECMVVVAFRGRQLLLRCRDYDQAVKWARLECRSYGIASITVEHIDSGQTEQKKSSRLHSISSSAPIEKK